MMAVKIRKTCIDCKYRENIECIKGLACPIENNEEYLKNINLCKKGQKGMLVIRFGKWSHKATPMFTYSRIFRNGYEWTPFCIKRFRYVD